MKKVIICVDDSPLNRAVCEYGFSVARAKGCPAVLLYVIKNQNLPASFFTLAAGGIAMYDDNMLEISSNPTDEEKAQAQSTLNSLEGIFDGVEIEKRIEFGNFLDILVKFNDEAALFVMNIKDEEGGELNKTPSTILSEVSAPVFFVNKNYSEVKSVLVAFDGLEGSRNVLESIKNSGFFANSLKFHIANVSDDEEKSNEILQIAREIINSENAEFITLSGEPSEAIIKYRRANNIDILATGALSRNVFASLFLGSVSKNIMKNALVPILVMA